jgi:molecular chaperone GrpE
MDDAEKSGGKPLRTASNKVRDLYDTYLKDKKVKNIPVKTPEEQQLTTDTGETEEAIVEEERQDNIEKDEPESISITMELENKLAEADREREELKDQLKRVAAELDNVRRRSIREKREIIDYANERLLFNLLPLLDDMEAALEAGKQKPDYDSLLKGIEMIYMKAKKLFEDAGVKPMEDPVGKPFDVNYHEAVMQMSSEFPVDTIVNIAQPGYLIHDKVLRHARVVTSSGEES